MNEPKAFSSFLSTRQDWRQAVAEAATRVREGLGGRCDLAVLFVTDLYPGLEPEALPALVARSLPCGALIGANASGVIAGSREVEMSPAVALLGMRLPGVKVAPFHLSAAESRAWAEGKRLLEALDVYPNEKPKFLALADPMSCDIDKCVGFFNEAFPGEPIVGGLASGMALGRSNWLLQGDEARHEGLVGVALSGAIDFQVTVAQGCRPIGSPWTVTKAAGQVLHELGGRPPIEVLRQTVGALSAQDQELARHSLFAGLVMDEYHARFRRGDFLIRNLMGYDAQSGALMIGANLRIGQTLQFQLRDARTSEEDLRAHLSPVLGEEAAREPAPTEAGERRAGARQAPAAPASGACGEAGRQGGLLVSCCGRGRGLYGEPDHDSRLIQELAGPLPLAGFFANGELGPVGRKNYIHGYTSSLVVMR